MKTTLDNRQLSLFDLTPPPVVQSLVPPSDVSDCSSAGTVEAVAQDPLGEGFDVQAYLKQYWSNSMDLVFSLINKLFEEIFDGSKDNLMEFVEYIKSCRLARVSAEVSGPVPNKMYDAYLESLSSLTFTRTDREKGKLVMTETNVLDYLVDVSFDEEEIDNLLSWNMSYQAPRVDKLYMIILTRGMEALRDTLRDFVQREKTTEHPYTKTLMRLGVPDDIIPDPSDKDAVLKAMLDGIGVDTDKFDMVIAYTDITPKELLAAGSPAERKRLNQVLAKKLQHTLAGFSGSMEWYRHAGFWRNEILLTEGVMHLAEHGGRNFSTAFWFIDVIASYQGEKKLVRHPFQVWKFIANPPGEDGTFNSGKVVCENGNGKVVVEQEIPYTDFLLESVTLYASYEPVDETGGKKRTIILLPSEY